MKRKFLSIMLITTMCVSLTACGGKDKENNRPQDTQTEESTQEESQKQTEEQSKEDSSVESTESQQKLSKSEQVAYDFLQAIQKEDYETVKTYLNVDTTYITPEDLEWLFPRTDLGDFIGSEEEISDVTSTGDKTDDIVNLNVGPKTAKIAVRLNDNNEWKVECYELYTTDWKIQAPKDMIVTLNGEEVPKSMIESSDERWDIYAIPAAPKKEIPLTFSGEKVGDFEISTTPGHGEYKVMLEFDSETANKIYDEVKQLMNDINAVYESGKTETSDYQQFVSEYASTDFINTLVDSVKSQYTWNNALHPRDITVTQVLGRTDNDDYKPCFVYTGNTIGVNLKVEKKWNEDHTDGSSARLLGYFILERTDDGVKLVGMSATNNPIEERNRMTRDW